MSPFGWKADIEPNKLHPVSGSPKREIWGAQLHVKPLPGQDGGLSGAAGAYAWVFALAEGEAEYRELASAEMAALGLFIAEIEGINIYDPHPEDDDQTRRCFERLSEEWPVQYERFYCYPVDDA